MAIFKTIPVSSLTAGAMLTAPIHDPENHRIKLLGEGTEITRDFLDRLAERNVQSVSIGVQDGALLKAYQAQGRAKSTSVSHTYRKSTLQNSVTEALDTIVRSGFEVPLSPQNKALPNQLSGNYDHDLEQQFASEHLHQIQALTDIFSRAVGKTVFDIDQTHQLIDQLIESLQADRDLFVCLSICPDHADYPSRHSLHTASLAIGIATILGWDRRFVRELGIGCLLHDFGMLASGIALYDSRSLATEEDLARLANHPVHSLEILDRCGGKLSTTAKMVAYQLHEKCNGRGYPRGFTAAQINPLAKIAAVADTYVGLVSPRPYREALLPYYAVKQILSDTRRGYYDPNVVRGLLQTISLFPIGSFVAIGQHQKGRILRSNLKQYGRPVVELYDIAGRTSRSTIVDLAEHPALEIVGPLAYGSFMSAASGKRRFLTSQPSGSTSVSEGVSLI